MHNSFFIHFCHSVSPIPLFSKKLPYSSIIDIFPLLSRQNIFNRHKKERQETLVNQSFLTGSRARLPKSRPDRRGYSLYFLLENQRVVFRKDNVGLFGFEQFTDNRDPA